MLGNKWNAERIRACELPAQMIYADTRDTLNHFSHTSLLGEITGFKWGKWVKVLKIQSMKLYSWLKPWILGNVNLPMTTSKSSMNY